MRWNGLLVRHPSPAAVFAPVEVAPSMSASTRPQQPRRRHKPASHSRGSGTTIGTRADGSAHNGDGPARGGHPAPQSRVRRRRSSRGRMTLVQRQQALLEQRGFSMGARGASPGIGFGAGAAAGAGSSAGAGAAALAARTGAQAHDGGGEQGRATLYWSSQRRAVEKRDLGHKCRECKQPFGELGEAIAVRRGARTELRYHVRCFSGTDDPRTQAASSFRSGKWLGSQGTTAPRDPYRKMRTQSHW